jgi:hypothetical protein
MRRLVPALLVLTLASPSTAQTQSTDTIPKELVSLLLRGPGSYPGDNFDIKIGAPENFPADLLPAGVKPAVSTTSERYVTVIAEAPNLSSKETLAFERELTARGWINPSAMSMRGLLSSSMMPSLNVCKGDQYAMLTFSPRAAGGSYIRVSLNNDPRRGSCINTPRPMSFFADVDVPQMFPPANVRAMGGGTSSGTDHYDQTVRMETTMSPGDVAAYYAGELEKAGWKRDGRANTEGVSVVRLSSVSRAKETVVAIVTATAMPDGKQIDVSLRLLRVDPRRFPPAGRGGVITGVVGGVCCR